MNIFFASKIFFFYIMDFLNVKQLIILDNKVKFTISTRVAMKKILIRINKIETYVKNFKREKYKNVQFIYFLVYVQHNLRFMFIFLFYRHFLQFAPQAGSRRLTMRWRFPILAKIKFFSFIRTNSNPHSSVWLKLKFASCWYQRIC